MTVYALTYAVGSPILAVAFNNLDRRHVLTLALCCLHRRQPAGGRGHQLRRCCWLPHADGARRRPLHADGARRRRGHRLARTARPCHRAGDLRHHGRDRARRSARHPGSASISAGGRPSSLVAILGAIALAGLLFGLPRGLPRTTATLGQAACRCAARRGAPCALVDHAALGSRRLHRLHLSVGSAARPRLQRHPISASRCWCSARCRRSAISWAARSPTGSGRSPTATLGACRIMASALTLQSVAAEIRCRRTCAAILCCSLIFLLGHRRDGPSFPAQLANLVRIEPAGFDDRAVAQCLRHVSRLCHRRRAGRRSYWPTLAPTDLGWIGGCSVAAGAGAASCFASWQARAPKLPKIAG